MSSGEFWVGPPSEPDTYRLVDLLGAGGEGEVWSAVLRLSAGGRRTVAVKIARSVGEDPDAAQRWQRFGHLLRSLSHPGLVRVTDVFTGPQKHREQQADLTSAAKYVVMDYIEGPTLREWCDENPDATASERLRKLRTVASALDEMHSGAATQVPVAHGDVKPTNIVVRAGGAGTVLVDLGLARLVDAVGMCGRSTPYAAPELRVPGALATPAADRYAFAVTTAQVLTGQQPPTGVDGWLDEQALHSLLRASPVTQRRPMLVRKVMEAITAIPEARPSQLQPWLDSAADALSQVTDVGASRPPATGASVDPPPLIVAAPRTASPQRGRRPLLIALALVVIVGAAAVGYTLRLSAGATPQATLPAAIPPPPSATISTSSSTAPPPALDQPAHAGTVDDLDPEEGFDFDSDDRQAPESVAGLDISGRRSEYVLDSVATTTGGLLVRLPPGTTNPHNRTECDRIPPTSWTKNVPGVPIGQSICVRTSDNNLAILTITKPWTGPSSDDRKISFTYRLWRNT